jgi:hypothetical protein
MCICVKFALALARNISPMQRSQILLQLRANVLQLLERHVLHLSITATHVMVPDHVPSDEHTQKSEFFDALPQGAWRFPWREHVLMFMAAS